jgi:hypothetical protein
MHDQATLIGKSVEVSFFKHFSIFGDTMWKCLYHVMKTLMGSMLQFNETSTSLLKNCGAIIKCLYKASHSWNMG